MGESLSRLAAAALSLLVPATVTPAVAGNLPEIVVSPYLVPTAIARAGSTVSVIGRDEIARSSAGTVADLLRSVPGVTVTENGGAGGQALVSLRGAETQHTLVLIDGIRVNDPASARDEFDFATLSLTAVERIEILRGPQSALYGSDAMGGVINIVTARPAMGIGGSATIEGGSYGTRRTTLSASGGSGPFSLSATGTYFANDGFSRVGDRDAGEPDATEKYAGTVRGSVAGENGGTLTFGVDGHHQMSEIDRSATMDATGYDSTRDLLSGFATLTLPAFDGGVTNTLTAFATRTTRLFGEPTRDYTYRASDVGVEYQAFVRRHGPGSLIVGGRLERETAYQKVSTSPTPAYDDSRLLYAGYLLYQLPAGDDLDLSFAARYDGEVDGGGFTTGRFTFMRDFPHTGVRLRGSVGTGAKRPTAFQLAYNPDLIAEESVGADLGVERTLLDGRASVSVTGFWNRFRNLIDFDGDFLTGTYKNIATAETSGVEVAASAAIVPGVIDAALSYTFLTTRDLATGLPLAKRPAHAGKASLTYTGIEDFQATLSATVVGQRFNDDAATVLMPAYLRVDLHASHTLGPHLTSFVRVENLLNASYQEVSGYNTAGLSAYAGLTWRR